MKKYLEVRFRLELPENFDSMPNEEREWNLDNVENQVKKIDSNAVILDRRVLSEVQVALEPR